MNFKMTNKPLSIFNFSSLTDIVMLLLIFFLLTSQFVILTGVKVQLPGAKENDQILPSQLVITITSEKRVFFANDEISLNEVAGVISMANEKIQSDNLIIRADKTVSIDIIIQVIDAGKGIGINKFTLETEKESF